MKFGWISLPSRKGLAKGIVAILSAFIGSGCSQSEEELSCTAPREKEEASKGMIMVPDTSSFIGCDKAISVAFKGMKSEITRSERGLTMIDSLLSPSGKTIAYVFNYGENEGYTVIGHQMYHAHIGF